MTSSLCSICPAEVTVGIQVACRNPWTKRYDLFRYCRHCASKAGEFDPEDKPDVVTQKPVAKPKRPASQTFIDQIDGAKR